MPFHVNRGLTLSATTWHVVLLGHDNLLFAYRPVLLRYRSLDEIEEWADIGHKLDGLVHCIEPNGIVQELSLIHI